MIPLLVTENDAFMLIVDNRLETKKGVQMKAETAKRGERETRSSTGRAGGAIDAHNHIYPQSFVEDIRRGRFGSLLHRAE